MQELLDFFLGAVHIYVVDPDLIPVVDAVCCVICVSCVMITACVLMVTIFKLLFRAVYSDNVSSMEKISQQGIKYH